jgi:hypothetical protein
MQLQGHRLLYPPPASVYLIVQARENKNKRFCYHGAVPGKPLARQAGKFVKHVLPAAIKPVHSLWHEVLGSLFLFFAAIGAWYIFRHPGALEPGKLAILVIFIVVMAIYGISSFRKARRISRS